MSQNWPMNHGLVMRALSPVVNHRSQCRRAGLSWGTYLGVSPTQVNVNSLAELVTL